MTGFRRRPASFAALAALAAIVAASVLSGCRRAEVRLSTEELVSRFNGIHDDRTRHLSIEYQGSPYAEGGETGSWIQRRLEERFNVSLHVNFTPIFSYDRLLMFRLIGGEIPDVYWLRNAVELNRAAEQGFALELPYEVIVRHAPDYVRLMQRISPDAWLLSARAGCNFGLPTFNINQATYVYPGIWNRTWLQRVGISEVPETLEQMEEALRRFRNRDPDGNGKRDTYGMCPWKPGASAGTLDRSFEEVFGAFGVFQNGWMLRDGQVSWGGILPDLKEPLALLRRWYADGLIHPDYMTLPIGNLAVRQQLISGTVGYIMGFNLNGWGTFDPRFPNSIGVLHAAVHPGEELAPAWLPIGPRGQRGVRTWAGSIGGIVAFGPQLVQSPEKLVRVLTWLNEMARDQDFYLDMRVARRGLHWEWDTELGMRKLPPYDNRAYSSKELLGEGIAVAFGDNYGYFAPFAPPVELLEKFTTEKARAFRDRFQRGEWGLKDVLLTADTVPSASKYLVTLIQLQAVAFTEIITGKKPLESFDEFVTAWRRQGGDLLTREANELYAQRQAIRDRVSRLLQSPASPPASDSRAANP